MIESRCQRHSVEDRIQALDPVEGCWPARAVAAPTERVLHLHLETGDDPQAGLVRALSRLGSAGYAQIAWPDMPRDALERAAMDAAARLRPTVIFMQLQTPDVITPAVIKRIRDLVRDPRLVIATWCGDVAGKNSPWDVDWQVPLAQAVDLTLHSSFTHVKALRSAGASRAAYLQIGYDEEQYHPPERESIAAREFDACFLGNRYYSPEYLASMREHDAPMRDAAIAALQQALGPRFALWGSGYKGGLGHIALRDAHTGYWRSRMGLNVSLHNGLDCYSSDRIFRILGCGSLLLVKSFPMMSVYGLKDSVNCVTWDDPDDLSRKAVEWASSARDDDADRIARAGAALARERHTWDARMHELVPLLAAVRKEQWS
jgi:hypothetical protein